MKRCAAFLCGVCVAAAVFTPVQSLWACSEIFLTKGGYYASSRTMDFPTPMFPMLVQSPRGVKRSAILSSGKDTPLSWEALYGSVCIYGMNIALCTDGLNEAGFSAAILWCEDSVYPTAQSDRALSVNVWAQYFLDRYAYVADAVVDARTIKVYNPIRGIFNTPLHLVLHDATGDSAIFEFDDAGNLDIYRPTTPIDAYGGVMTNEPFFPAQLANLTYYEPWGGGQVIPGDDDSLSRFVRGSYCLRQMLTPTSSAQAAIFAFNFIQFLATPMITDPHGEIAWPTIWTSVRDHQGLAYAFNAWDAPSLRHVSLKELDFTAGQSMRAQWFADSAEGDVSEGFYGIWVDSDFIIMFKPLSVNPTRVAPQIPFSYSLYLNNDITKAFDFYVFAETPIGVYSIDFDGVLYDGIVPILKNILSMKAPVLIRVDPKVILPAEASGQPITFYTVAVEAGKIPIISSLDDLNGTSPYVIYMDKESMTVK